MAKFVLTAELAVRNQNLRPVITQLQKQLNSVKANVTLKLDASTKGKLDNINKALAITDQRLKSAAGAAVVLNQQISQLNKTLGGNLKQLNQVTKTAQANAKAMTATSKAANQTASGMTRLGQQSAFAIKRIAAFSVATSAVIALTTAMKSGIQEAILFQHGLVRVSQITGTSIKNLGGLTAEITRLSTTLGVSSQELLNVSDTLAQAGLSANEVTVALEALAKTKLAPTFGKIEDTVEGVIASMRQFKIEAKDLEATLGSFNSVAAAFAVESQDIVTAVRRSGAAFQAAGGSLEEFIALFTSVRQTTRESAETIATGFRTIFTRIQRPKTLGFLRDLGVELLDLKGQFVGPYEAVRRLSDALAAIPGNDPRFAQIIEELGGFRQVSKVIPLIQQFAVAEKALAVAQRGRGSLTRDAVTAQQSLLVQLTKLRERFFELFRTIGDNTAIQGFLGLTLKIADNLITVGQSLTPLIPLFTAIGAIKLSSGLRQFTGGFLGKANSGTQSASSTNNKLNTVQASATTANVNQSAAVSSNTVALNNLAAQINSLSGVLKASIAASTKTVIGPGGIARQVPRKFANGGIVPGVGNSDSVHARLMPGEFVIPKPAVNAIGADNLAMMARGGKTRRYAFGGKVGMASLYGPDSIPNSQQKLDLDKKFLQDKTALTPQFKNRYGIGASGDYDFTMVAGTINQKSAEGFDRTLEQAIEPVVAQYANNYLKLLSPGTSYIKQDLSKFGFDAMSGNIFEATIAAVGPPFDKDNNAQRFDFPSGLGNAAGPLFNKPELSNTITDAKRTYSNDSIKSIREKVYKLLKSENDEYWSRLSSKQKDALVSSQVGRIQSRAPSLSGVDLAKQKRIEKQNKRLGFASGGQAIGTDTVDARLTPGEYVFDVESAKRIGYNNLEQMRKQRFAKGGRVHRFGSGGKAPVTTQAAGGNFTGLLVLSNILPSIIGQFGNLDESLQKTITEIVSLVSIVGLAGKSFITIDGGFKKLSTDIGSYRSSLKELKDVNARLAYGNDVLGQVKANPRNYHPQQVSNLQNGMYTLQQRKNLLSSETKGGNPLKGLIGQNLGGALAIGGIVGGFAGDKISRSANDKIASGSGTSSDVNKAGIGGALSGAGAGAGIGFAVGGAPGAAVGAILGGLYGYVSAVEEAKKQIENVRLDSAFKSFEKSLNRISKNKVLSTNDISTIKNQASTLSTNLAGASVEDRKELLGKAQSSLPQLDAVASTLAGTVKSIDEFKTASNGVGAVLIQTIAEISGLPISEIEEQMSKTIKIQQNNLAIQTKIDAALQGLYNDSKYITDLSRAFSDSSVAMQKFVNQANNINNDFLNLQFDSNFDEIIAKGLEANPVDLTNAITQLIGQGNGNNLANRLGASAQASRALPDILRAAAQAGPLSNEGDSPLSGFGAAVTEGIRDFPDELRNAIELKLGEFLKDDSADSKFLEKVRDNAEQFAKEMQEGTDEYFKSLSEAAQTAKASANSLIGIIQQRNAIEQKVTELSINASTTRFKANRQRGLIGTNKFNDELSSQDANQLFNIQQNRRLSGTGLTSNASSATLGSAISSRRSALDKLQDKRNTLSPVSEDFKSVSNEIRDAESELTKLTSALNEQATSTDRLTALQGELATAENKRKAQLSVATSLAFGGREGRAEFAKSAQNARAIAANPSAIGSAEQEGSAASFLDKVIEMGAGDKKLAQLNGKSANQVKEERLTSLVGAEDAKALINASNEEKELQRKVVDAQLGMADAQDQLLKLEEQKFDMINNTLVNGFNTMRVAFEASVAAADARQSKAKEIKAQNEYTKTAQTLGEGQAAKSKLQQLGLAPDEATNISNNKVRLTEIKKAYDVSDKMPEIEQKAKGDTLDAGTGIISKWSKDDAASRERIRKLIAEKVKDTFGDSLSPDELNNLTVTAVESGLKAGTDESDLGINFAAVNRSVSGLLTEKAKQVREKVETAFADSTTIGVSNVGNLLQLDNSGPNSAFQQALTSADKASQLTPTREKELQAQKEEQAQRLRESRATANRDTARANNLRVQQSKPLTIDNISGGSGGQDNFGGGAGSDEIKSSTIPQASIATAVTPQLTGRALAYQKMREAKAASRSPLSPDAQQAFGMLSSIPSGGKALTLEESRDAIAKKQAASQARVAAVPGEIYNRDIQSRVAGYQAKEGSAGEKFINKMANPMTSAASSVGESLSDTFKSGANILASNLTSTFDAFANKIPTDIGLVAKFEPLIVQIAGGEMFQGLEEKLSAGIMAKIVDQLSKVMPVGFKGAMGPQTGQNKEKK